MISRAVRSLCRLTEAVPPRAQDILLHRCGRQVCALDLRRDGVDAGSGAARGAAAAAAAGATPAAAAAAAAGGALSAGAPGAVACSLPRVVRASTLPSQIWVKRRSYGRNPAWALPFPVFRPLARIVSSPSSGLLRARAERPCCTPTWVGSALQLGPQGYCVPAACIAALDLGRRARSYLWHVAQIISDRVQRNLGRLGLGSPDVPHILDFCKSGKVFHENSKNMFFLPPQSQHTIKTTTQKRKSGPEDPQEYHGELRLVAPCRFDRSSSTSEA